jgi:hypothetical protein
MREHYLHREPSSLWTDPERRFARDRGRDRTSADDEQSWKMDRGDIGNVPRDVRGGESAIFRRMGFP